MQQVPLLHRFSLQPMQHGGCVQATNHDILHQLLVTTDAKGTFCIGFRTDAKVLSLLRRLHMHRLLN